MKKRILACILAGLMLMPLASCGESVENETQGATEQQTSATTEIESDAIAFPDIEKQDYKGETFRIIGLRTAGSWVFGDEDGYKSGNSSVLNDVLYETNTLVEDHLGIVMEYEYVEHVPGTSALFKKVQPTVMSGDDVYQLCIIDNMRNVSPFVTQDCSMDFYELKDVNLDQPYWNRKVIKDLEIGNCAYIATGDLCYYQVLPLYCNKDLLTDSGREVPYDKVRNGTWTLDEFLSITAGLYRDNGDGKANNLDTYGFAGEWSSSADSMPQACGIRIVTRSDDGSFELTLYNDRFLGMYEKLSQWAKNESTYLYDWGSRENENIAMNFLDNRSYFTQSELSTQYLAATFSVGILPLPKYDVAQANYAHMNWGDNITILKTVKNVDMVGQALELMSYYSKTMVRPTYYDEVLQLRVSDAPDDREMVELICNTIVYDPGIAYGQECGELCSLIWLTRNVMSGKDDITSTYKKLQRSAERYLSQKVYKTE